MEKLSCAILGDKPQRFKFKYNEQAPLCRKIKTAIAVQLKTLYEKGVRTFYVGCAVGVDTWAAEIILELKQRPEFSEMQLFCAIPFPEQHSTFTAGQKKRYQSILDGCDGKEIVSRHFSPVVYKRLHYYMIDRSQHLIAVHDRGESERSGLAQAVNYAIKNDLQITIIHPDTAVISG